MENDENYSVFAFGDSFNFGNWACYRLYQEDLRDKKEKRILNTIKKVDVQGLKFELENPVGFRLGINDIPILSVAALKGAQNVVEFLIDSGCDLQEVDNHGSTALHLIVSEYAYEKQCECEEDGIVCDMCKTTLREIVETLLTASADAVDAVFFKVDEMQMTPFLLACKMGHDEIISRFLALLDNNSISIPRNRLIGYDTKNVFHFLLDSPFENMPPERDDTLWNIFDRFPFAKQMIDEKYKYETAIHGFLHKALVNGWIESWRAVELTKICFQNGASPDVLDRSGMSYFNYAVLKGNARLVEMLLRAGCRTDVHFLGPSGSPLSHFLRNNVNWSKLESIRMIELLLAFGYDLQKELILYMTDELPFELETTWHIGNRDPTGIDPDILAALREMRRSQVLLNLQRQCRNTIRRNLKGKADKIIADLTCIPNSIKSFLMVVNERALLNLNE